MRLHLDLSPTPVVLKIPNGLARVWQGMTDDGIVVQVMISSIGIRDGQGPAAEQLNADLRSILVGLGSGTLAQYVEGSLSPPTTGAERD